MTDDAEMTEDALPKICPECGEPTEVGFGLAGGGYGAYVFCECGFFSKVQEKGDA
jgi:hypothetical protein